MFSLINWGSLVGRRVLVKPKFGRHAALITRGRLMHVKTVKIGGDTFVEFRNFNELREVFEEVIKSMESRPDVRKLSDPSS
mgnify:CR=1 FL=1